MCIHVHVHVCTYAGTAGGKSAIMTAIVVGLGGLASITQRGSSLKEFIRSGSQYVHVHTYVHTLYKLDECTALWGELEPERSAILNLQVTCSAAYV